MLVGKNNWIRIGLQCKFFNIKIDYLRPKEGGHKSYLLNISVIQIKLFRLEINI